MNFPILLARPQLSCRFPTLIESTTLGVVTALSVPVFNYIYQNTENDSFKQRASWLLYRIALSATTILGALSLFSMTQKKYPNLSLAGLSAIVLPTLYFTLTKEDKNSEEDFSTKYRILPYLSAWLLNSVVTAYFLYQQCSRNNTLRFIGSIVTPILHNYCDTEDC